MNRETFFNLVKTDADETLDDMSKETAYYMKVYAGKRWFNWSAFFFKEWWCFYRKMYLVGILYFLFIESVVFISPLYLEKTFNLLTIYDHFIIAGFMLVGLGFLGNVLYYAYIRRLHAKGIKHAGVSERSVWFAVGSYYLSKILVWSFIELQFPDYADYALPIASILYITLFVCYVLIIKRAKV